MEKALVYAKKTMALSAVVAVARFKSRNEGKYLGFLWYLLDPMLLFGTILLIRNAALPQGNIDQFPAYLLIGLLFLSLFSKITTDSVAAIGKNEGLIKNFRIPFETLVVSEVVLRLIMHIFEVVFLLGVVYVVAGSVQGIVGYIAVLFLFLFFVTGVSLFLATVGAFVKDLANIWAPFTRLLLFITPIFYVVPRDSFLEVIDTLNPLSFFIGLARAAMFNATSVESGQWGTALILSGTFFLGGLLIFKRAKHVFPELV